MLSSRRHLRIKYAYLPNYSGYLPYFLDWMKTRPLVFHAYRTSLHTSKISEHNDESNLRMSQNDEHNDNKTLELGCDSRINIIVHQPTIAGMHSNATITDLLAPCCIMIDANNNQSVPPQLERCKQ